MKKVEILGTIDEIVVTHNYKIRIYNDKKTDIPPYIDTVVAFSIFKDKPINYYIKPDGMTSDFMLKAQGFLSKQVDKLQRKK